MFGRRAQSFGSHGEVGEPRSPVVTGSLKGAGDALLAGRQLAGLDARDCHVGKDGQFTWDFRDVALTSAFQCIVRASDQQVYAHEALLRARDRDGRPVSPVVLFERASALEDGRLLDRAVRLLHVGNFYRQLGANARLFLNVHGRHIEARDVAHGEFFAAALADQGLSASAITIEVLESSIEDNTALEAAIRSYKAFGFRVAIDDFGARHSNFDRVWQLDPDYVKLDRSLVVAAASNSRARIVLPKIVEILHDLGARVVCEGIEDEQHAKIARESGADFLQGYLFGRPAAAVVV
ncbi:EAL domain-containing protein [Hyphomicrobium sp.]|uniref:EAL domain-containing protein n=1 Tax=Hyphomicrobium sp. TaxID=82 RepID=UPI002CE95487|nr:EAL domain-containing protein [Hyphomicrobium sp.]HRN88824.1 EAL domain-containing protein [Hyphomicrobium sp.]HRQ27454.1 EAL domain-containing protein [Hyphomicrobium sp.]